MFSNSVVDDLVLGFCQQVRLREGGLRNAGTGISSAELGDDVVEVLLCAEALPFEHLYNPPSGAREDVRLLPVGSG